MREVSVRAAVFVLALMLLFTLAAAASTGDSPSPKTDEPVTIDQRIWSISYWQQLAAQGLVDVAPDTPFEPATWLPADELDEFEDGPDVVTSFDLAVHQSENSIFVDPNNPEFALNSNNSSQWPLGQFYGVSSFFSADQGVTWAGTPDGWGGGDPAACIDYDGNFFLGHIGSNQSSNATGVTVSSDGGQTYTTYQVAPSGGAFLDKNHLWIDLTDSPYQGRLYAAWTPFGGTNDEDIAVAWSDDDAQTWSGEVNVSGPVGNSALCQGVNLDVGPNGEVYACWAQYDTGALTESSIGFARSFDGGVTWEPAIRAIEDINGIRSYPNMQQNHRKNSFPVMTTDISGGPNDGRIYIVWTNVGVPGVNDGPDVAVWMIYSDNQGETWSESSRIQTDDPAEGNQHYFPWIHCDATTGTLNAIWYDNRNTTGGAVEVWIGFSYDGSETWEDYRVSDVSFTPAPIPGFAAGYFGDYLGIYARDGIVYPCWTDNRSGVALTYVSSYLTERPPASISLSTEFAEPIAVPPGGGTIFYGASLSYNLEIPLTGNAWTQVILPNGNVYPLNTYTIPFTPGWSLEVTNQSLTVPGGAPAGYYTFVAKVGQFPNLVVDEDSFEFVKIGFVEDGGSQWTTSRPVLNR